MKRKVVILSFLSLLCLHFGFAQENWQSLFNGKDLTGWKIINGEAKYTVKDGEIIGNSVFGTPNTFLITEKTYGDFILELDLKVVDSMNSGVQIRSLSKEDFQNGRVHGYQVEVDPSPRAWSGGIYDEARRGWIYPGLFNPDARKAFKKKEWNHYRIEAIGNTIRTWVNGVPVASLVDDMTAEGFIALQVHEIYDESETGSEIRWKNIRIQTENLTPSPYDDDVYVVNLIPNSLSEQEKAQNYYLLWDGKTTEGWRRVYKEDFPTVGWEIKDGVLTIHKSNGEEQGSGGDIITKKKYSAFDLSFEFKLTEGANSGVKYFVNEDYDSKGLSAIGLEYQLLDDAHHPDAKLGRNGNRTLGSLYDLIPRNDLKEKMRPPMLNPVGEWNKGRLIVFPNGHVEHWLNGYKLLAYEKGSKLFQELISISKYKDWENFGMWEEGHILLQDHGNEVSFRSIKIKELN